VFEVKIELKKEFMESVDLSDIVSAVPITFLNVAGDDEAISCSKSVDLNESPSTSLKSPRDLFKKFKYNFYI
jgi:hypothetical protein